MKLLSGLKKAAKPAAAVIGLVAIIIWTTGVLRERVPPGTLPHDTGIPVPDSAETLYVEKKPVSRFLDVTGTVSSEKTVHISARLNGHVTGVHAGAGTPVAEGALLISLDDREILEQLSAALAVLELAQIEYDRTKRLLESGAATHKSYNEAASALRRARAVATEAEVMLSFTEIKSPIDGVVTERRIEAGDLASPGRVLMVVYDPEAMRMEIHVPVRLAGAISPGDHLQVQLETPFLTCKGEVTEILAMIDPVSRTRTIRVSLPHECRDILPGAFGRVWIERSPEVAIFIPQTAVYRVGQLEIVQVVADGRVTRRLVKTGPVQDGRVEILSGLASGESILAQPIPAAFSSIIPAAGNSETED